MKPVLPALTLLAWGVCCINGGLLAQDPPRTDLPRPPKVKGFGFPRTPSTGLPSKRTVKREPLTPAVQEGGDLDQEKSKKRYRELEAAWYKASQTGNDLLIREKRAELEAYLSSTLRRGRRLNGWLGQLDAVQATGTTARDEQGVPQSVVSCPVSLRDPWDPSDNHLWVEQLRVSNYDPFKQRVVGRTADLRALRSGDWVRVSGIITEVAAPKEFGIGLLLRPRIELVATRIERVEPKKEREKERSALLTALEQAEAAAKQATAAQRKLLNFEVGFPVNNATRTGTPLLHAGIAAAIPEFAQAVKELRAFKPYQDYYEPRQPDFGKVREDKFAALRKRLTQGPVVDEKQERATLRSWQKDAETALADVQRQLKNATVVKRVYNDMWTYRLRVSYPRRPENRTDEQYVPPVREGRLHFPGYE